MWLGHQRRTGYWKHGSVTEDFSAIKAKVLGLGGLGDTYKNAVPGLIANIEGTKEVERDDIRLRTETFAEMWSDKTHFHLNARMEAYENDVLIFERDMQESIERDGL